MVTRRTLLSGVGLGVILPARTWAAPAKAHPVRLQLPEPTGRYPVGTSEVHLVDRLREDPFVPGRARELMISIWYPAARGSAEPARYLPPRTAAMYAEDAARQLGQPVDAIDWQGARVRAGHQAPVSRACGRSPVILYSPGFGVPRGLGSALVTELASHGYVVVTVDHTYEVAGVEFPDGRFEVQTLPSKDYARLVRNTRLADQRFVLDVLAVGGGPLPHGLRRVLDLSRVGVFGHSAGGVGAADLTHADRRVGAGVNLDGPLGWSYPSGSAPVVEHGLDRPFLIVGAGGTGPGGGPLSHRHDPDLGRFWDRSTGWKRDLNVPRGMHYSFTDHLNLLPLVARHLEIPPELVARTIGSADPAAVHRALTRYLPAFFDQHLRHRPSHLWSRPGLPETTFIS